MVEAELHRVRAQAADAQRSVEDHKAALGNLDLTAALYRDLMAREPSELTLNEWLRCRVHERDVAAAQKRELVELERDALLQQLEVRDALLDQLHVTQTNLELEMRQAQQSASNLEGIRADLEHALAAERARSDALSSDLQRKQKLLQEFMEAGAHQVEVVSNHKRLV